MVVPLMQRQRNFRFEVERVMLVRTATLKDGRSYVHRCTLETLREVAWWIEEHGADGVTTNELWDALPDLPATQISVALEFLKERGCMATRGRRNYPASSALYEDAMVEYHALEA